jgi:NitT/TauT family transport system substrate-binding protein
MGKKSSAVSEKLIADSRRLYRRIVVFTSKFALKGLFLLMLLFLVGCATQAGQTPTAVAPVSTAVDTLAITPEAVTVISLPMGYIPDPQYAPFYVAMDKGYYAAEGLEIVFDYSFETDGVALVGAGHLPFAIVSGEQALLARAQEIPVVYVLQWFQRFPIAVVSKAAAGIETVTDLRGRQVGLPGFFGATYVGYAGLLFAHGLTLADVNTEEIGFTQVEALLTNRVDAVVGYANNEPLQVAARGEEVNVLYVADSVNMVANGIITNERTIAENPELVERFVRATLRGLAHTLAQPEEAYAISKKFVEGLDDSRLNVLAASLDLWRADTLGLTDPVAWQQTQDVLLRIGFLDRPLDNLEAAFTNRFVEAAQP